MPLEWSGALHQVPVTDTVMQRGSVLTDLVDVEIVHLDDVDARRASAACAIVSVLPVPAPNAASVPRRSTKMSGSVAGTPAAAIRTRRLNRDEARYVVVEAQEHAIAELVAAGVAERRTTADGDRRIVAHDVLVDRQHVRIAAGAAVVRLADAEVARAEMSSPVSRVPIAA